ncbi:MAG TPA: hypothetical protein VGH44_03600 [Candidatus Saccharimonadia bacterium]|jgi:hypothetical protein
MASESIQTKTLTGRARGQLGMLITIFLLGMGVNLLGDPGSGLARATKGVLLGLHVLVAIGLVVGAFLTVRLTHELDAYHRLARIGGASIGIALLSGILNLTLKSDWWSFLMAVGFIAAVVCYGLLYVKTRVASATGRPGV